MTTLPPPGGPAVGPGAAQRLGFWCENTAHTLGIADGWRLACQACLTPRLAIRWMHRRAAAIAEQLNPDAAHVTREWLADDTELGKALARLRAGELYAHTIHDDGVHYSLFVQPIQPAPLVDVPQGVAGLPEDPDPQPTMVLSVLRPQDYATAP